MKRIIPGHVEPRKDSNGNITHYRAVIDLGRDPGGKRIRPYRRAETEEEAEALLIQMKAEYLKDEFIHPSEMKVEDYLEKWFDAYVVNNRSDSTIFDYRQVINRYLKPTWGKVKLQSLNTLQMQTIFNKWSVESPYTKGKPLSLETLKHIRRTFNTALNKAVELEYIRKNPLKGVSLRSAGDSKEVQIMSEEDTIKLFNAVKCTDMELPVALLFDSLARRSELLGAQWKDVNLETGEFTIRHTYVRTLEGSKMQTKTKTKSSHRTLILTDYTLNLLKREKFNQKENKMKYQKNYHDNDLIICQENGKPFQTSSMSQKWRRTLKKNSIPPCKLHTSRHTSISQMIAMDMNPKLIQERAGHSDISITMNIYTHVSKEQKIKTAKMINDGMFKKLANE